MQGKRKDRVGHLIQMELSQTILRRVKDPRLGFVTITHVELTPDLKSAIVSYSVMGDEKAKRDSQIALEKAKGFLQRQLGAGLELRYTPKLVFRLDRTLDHQFEIDRILQEINEKKPETGQG